MEELFTALLIGDAALAAVVTGADGVIRIHWQQLPIGASLPAITLEGPVTASADYTMGGRSGLVRYLVQVDIWAGTHSEALAIVRQALRRDGPLGGRQEPPLQIFVQDVRAGWDRTSGPDSNRSTDLYRASIDLVVWHTEP